MHQSVWTDIEQKNEFKTLDGDARTDVLIIGGGICGVLCAWFLQQQGVDYMLVDKGRIGEGITQNTTAKITSQHGLIYDKLIRSLGRERAALYFAANQKAVAQYRELASTIACDFEEKTAGVYSRTDRQKIEKEVRAVNDLGFPAEFVPHLSLPFEIEGAVLFPNQAQFHPLKFLSVLAQNLNIYQYTHVHMVENHTAWTNHGRITADKIIIATHFPFLNHRGSYFLKLYQSRSYVLALKQAPDVNGMFIDEAKDGFSFRNYKDLLLLGGGSHRTGKSGGKWQELRIFAESAYPKAQEVYSWATQDCMSLDAIPYIGHYSRHTPNLYVATGYNKWGMTSSMVAAILLSDLILERENPWKDVFSPSRTILKPQLLVNGLEAVGNLLAFSRKRCPHMGCTLKWNPQEHTWDCPCHGSRFEENGKLIDNPSNRNASSMEKMHPPL